MADTQAFEAWWDGRGLPDNLKAAFFMVWQAALASRPAEVDDEGLISNSREIDGIAQPSGNAGELPAVLFDGDAVYSEITRKLGKAHCHSHETVSETLDAVVRLLRSAPSHTTNKEK